MNWEIASSMSEILGSIAVVITLFYLIVENRKNARALNANSSREFGMAFGNWHLDVAGKPEALRILVKAMDSNMQEFSVYEWTQFRLLAVSNFYILQTAYLHSSAEIGNIEESRNMIGWAKALVNTFPAWERFWSEEAQAGTFTEEFRNAVDTFSGHHSARFVAEGQQ